MTPLTYSPEANYLSRNNIVVPVTVVAGRVTAMAAAARVEFNERTGLTLTNGTIDKAGD